MYAETRYGEIPPDRVDVRTRRVTVVDLRAETGDPRTPDATRVVDPPHDYALSAFGEVGDGWDPVAEVLLVVNGREVSLVGALTGRPGVVEVTPDHLGAALSDPGYARRLAAWAGVADGLPA